MLLEIVAMTLTLTSPAFAANGSIPKRYTCEGADISPPLAWSGAPAGAKSLGLVVDDPDAPDPNAPKRVWVLDTVLPDLGKPTKAQVLEAMKDHVLATAELIGTYQKGR